MHISKGQGAREGMAKAICFQKGGKEKCFMTSCILNQVFRKIRVS